jgi:hypothetical protein
MAIGRSYWVHDMASFADEVDVYDGLHYYVWTGTIPSWFNVEPFYPGATEHYPTFTFTTPQGLSDNFSFGIEKYTNAGVLVEASLVVILVQAWNNPIWTPEKGCYTANLAWFDPSGGWESYLFIGKQQTFQDKGTDTTYINSIGEKRFHRKDEIHQGTIITTGKVTVVHAEYIADLFKAIQAYLWTPEEGFIPIIITSKDFKRVKSGDAYAQYDFEFRFAEEDVIQTQ